MTFSLNSYLACKKYMDEGDNSSNYCICIDCLITSEPLQVWA